MNERTHTVFCKPEISAADNLNNNKIYKSAIARALVTYCDADNLLRLPPGTAIRNMLRLFCTKIELCLVQINPL
jgi:hypothetical protein